MVNLEASIDVVTAHHLSCWTDWTESAAAPAPSPPVVVPSAKFATELFQTSTSSPTSVVTNRRRASKSFPSIPQASLTTHPISSELQLNA